jgi:hypothetical protein
LFSRLEPKEKKGGGGGVVRESGVSSCEFSASSQTIQGMTPHTHSHAHTYTHQTLVIQTLARRFFVVVVTHSLEQDTRVWELEEKERMKGYERDVSSSSSLSSSSFSSYSPPGFLDGTPNPLYATGDDSGCTSSSSLSSYSPPGFLDGTPNPLYATGDDSGCSSS